MIRSKGVQSHDQTRVTEVMIKRKGVQSHEQTERGTES